MTTGTAAGGGVDGDSSVCEAPQLRQNFAVVATCLPHSGQYDMISRTMKLNPLSYEHCFRKEPMAKIRYRKFFCGASFEFWQPDWISQKRALVSFSCYEGLLQSGDECSR
jgi:hypothetical protein